MKHKRIAGTSESIGVLLGTSGNTHNVSTTILTTPEMSETVSASQEMSRADGKKTSDMKSSLDFKHRSNILITK